MHNSSNLFLIFEFGQFYLRIKSNCLLNRAFLLQNYFGQQCAYTREIIKNIAAPILRRYGSVSVSHREGLKDDLQ